MFGDTYMGYLGDQYSPDMSLLPSSVPEPRDVLCPTSPEGMFRRSQYGIASNLFCTNPNIYDVDKPTDRHIRTQDVRARGEQILTGKCGGWPTPQTSFAPPTCRTPGHRSHKLHPDGRIWAGGMQGMECLDKSGNPFPEGDTGAWSTYGPNSFEARENMCVGGNAADSSTTLLIIFILIVLVFMCLYYFKSLDDVRTHLEFIKELLKK